MDKKYTVVFGVKVRALKEEVNSLLDQGWLPCGGVSYDPVSECFMQAMTYGV